MKTETKEQRMKRVIARGEFSNHSHVITGDVLIEEKNGRTIITVTEDSNACLKHLLEKEFLETGKEVWTHEHEDIKLEPGKYEFLQQNEYDPYNDIIKKVID